MENLLGNSSAFQSVPIVPGSGNASFIAECFELAKALYGMRDLLPGHNLQGFASVLAADAKAPSLKIATLRPTVGCMTAARAAYAAFPN